MSFQSGRRLRCSRVNRPAVGESCAADRGGAASSRHGGKTSIERSLYVWWPDCHRDVSPENMARRAGTMINARSLRAEYAEIYGNPYADIPLPPGFPTRQITTHIVELNSGIGDARARYSTIQRRGLKSCDKAGVTVRLANLNATGSSISAATRNHSRAGTNASLPGIPGAVRQAATRAHGARKSLDCRSRGGFLQARWCFCSVDVLTTGTVLWLPVRER